MSCAAYELDLSLFAAGALEGRARALLEAHLAGCPACRKALEGSKAVIASAELPPLSLRDQAQIAQISRVAPRPFRQWPLQVAAIAAALVAVVLGVRAGSPHRHPLRPVSGPVQRVRASPPPTELLPTLAEGLELEDDAPLDALPSSFDEESDSALYDAVVFQEVELPYQVDNG
jgi:hypothetical protein